MHPDLKNLAVDVQLLAEALNLRLVMLLNPPPNSLCKSPHFLLLLLRKLAAEALLAAARVRQLLHLVGHSAGRGRRRQRHRHMIGHVRVPDRWALVQSRGRELGVHWPHRRGLLAVKVAVAVAGGAPEGVRGPFLRCRHELPAAVDGVPAHVHRVVLLALPVPNAVTAAVSHQTRGFALGLGWDVNFLFFVFLFFRFHSPLSLLFPLPDLSLYLKFLSFSLSPHIPPSSTSSNEPNPKQIGFQMAMQAESPAGAPSAQVVGNAFVEQYYQILHQSPELVFRFYQDSSVLSRPDARGAMTSVTTMRGINDKILSLNYKDYMAEIKTADAQPSFGEGVTVLVTGCLTGRDDVRKKFVQSFFLAPQEKGYFVLNDVFRYVEENKEVGSPPVSVSALRESAPETTPMPDPVQPTHVPEDPATIPETSEEDPNDGAEVCDPSDNEGSVVEDEVVAEPPANPSQTENTAVDSVPSIPEGDEPKKSYASIVKYRKANPTPTKSPASTNDVRTAPPKIEQQSQQSREPTKPAPVSEPIGSTVETAPESNTVLDEVEGHSIYVRNLPLNATAAQLEQVFNTFGPIKQGGVQVRSNKQGFCYGFVEFESADSMGHALEASPVMIGNRKAVVEQKRTATRVMPNTIGGSGRGRYPPAGRVNVFRSDNFRGRGNYGGGGRGYGRNSHQGEYVARNRRGSESYQRVDHNGAERGSGGNNQQQGVAK